MFRRYGFVAGVVGLALTAPSTALAAEQDSVSGGGISALQTHFGFAAQSTPTGAQGYASFKNFLGGGSDRSGRVTCVRVSGNTAVFGIEDRNPDGTVVYRQFFVRDNGEPVGGVAVDELKEVGSGSPTELACADPTQQGSGLVLQQGNIVVRDVSDPVSS